MSVYWTPSQQYNCIVIRYINLCCLFGDAPSPSRFCSLIVVDNSSATAAAAVAIATARYTHFHSEKQNSTMHLYVFVYDQLCAAEYNESTNE